MKLAGKFSLVMILIALIPLLSASMLTFNAAREGFETNAFEHLAEINSLKKDELKRWLENSSRELELFAQRPLVREYVGILTQTDPTSIEYQDAQDKLFSDHMEAILKEGGKVSKVFIIDAETGLILASTLAEDVGKYRENEDYFILGKENTHISGASYSLVSQDVHMHISTPIYAAGEIPIAVAVVRLDASEMSRIMLKQSEDSASEETYLVNNFNFLVTESRFQEGLIFKKIIKTSIVDDCLAGNNGRDYYQDYRGVDVIGVYQWLPELEICIVTKIDQQEAFAQIQEIKRSSIQVGVLTSIIVVIIAFIFARGLTRPISIMMKGVEGIGAGKLEGDIPIKGKDELAELATAFNQMAVDLANVNLEKEDLISELQSWGKELEKRVAERTIELEENKAFSDSIINSLPGILYLVDVDGRFLRWNKNFERVSGYTSEEIKEKHPADFFEGEEKTLILERFHEVFVQGESYTNANIVAKDGTKTPYILTGVKAEMDGQDYLIGTGVDMTELQKTQEALEAAKEYAEGLIETANALVVVVDEQGNIKTFNKVAENITGYKKSELVNRNWFEIVVPKDRYPEVWAENKRLFSGGVPKSFENPIITKSGEERYISWSNSEVLRNGKTNSVISFGQDITQRKLTENALEKNNIELNRSNRELEQFAYVASHDLQEPLRMVTSYLQLLEKRYSDKLDGDALEFINYAVDGAKRMKSLIIDLLTFSRVGTHGKEPEIVSAQEVMDKVLLDFDVLIQETSATIKCDPLPQVLADRSQLQQLFQNLLGNAIKFRRDDPPQIYVHVEKVDGMWQFMVKDNGIGIDPGFFEQIFIIFQRLHTSQEYKGTGMGLAICKKIVERHGGKIWVESTPGKGSEFYFTLKSTSE
ncbi:PAS domain S-box protein [bacterium]|nr:PAS domain S-box protein [bacterium]